MAQLVFLHGPAGACADAFHYQLKHFTGSVAPTLPGYLQGIIDAFDVRDRLSTHPSHTLRAAHQRLQGDRP